jgi:hypothetical protein
MAVAIVTTDLPEGVGPGVHDPVNTEPDLTSDPATGRSFHWAGHVDGKRTITDLWASRAAYDRFHAERLFPAIQKACGIDPTTGPRPTITEHPVHDYVRA